MLTRLWPTGTDIVSMAYCTCIQLSMVVFLKLGESIYMAMDLIPILLGSLLLAHNAQHSLVAIPNAHTQDDLISEILLW